MPISKRSFQTKLLDWYHGHHRDLPWRHTQDPYFIWLSEIMLQQTRVDQGLPYYLKFTKTLPSVVDFAQASEDHILQMWEGLGYYSRARNMMKAAKIVVEEYNGVFPTTYDQLLLLPGIGPYTAAAISSICFEEAQAVVDGNVIRVLSRIYGLSENPKSTVGKKIFAEKAQKLIDKNNPGDYNQAIMEFGAVHCTPKKPECTSCIFHTNCEADKQNMQDEWPTKSVKKARKKRYLHYYVCLADGQLLIQKRDDKDIYRGLYQLPMIEHDRRPSLNTVRRELKAQGVHSIKKVESIHTELRQVLSHQEIYARFYRIYPGWSWQDLSNGFSLVKVKNLSKFAMPRVLRHFFTNFELL